MVDEKNVFKEAVIGFNDSQNFKITSKIWG